MKFDLKGEPKSYKRFDAGPCVYLKLTFNYPFTFCVSCTCSCSLSTPFFLFFLPHSNIIIFLCPRPPPQETRLDELAVQGWATPDEDEAALKARLETLNGLAQAMVDKTRHEEAAAYHARVLKLTQKAVHGKVRGREGGGGAY